MKSKDVDMSDRPVILQVEDLHKTFHIGFWRKRVDAVRGVSFTLRQGEVFGLIGPNGAGKTTTLKTVLGLIFPTKGKITLFGEPAGTPAVRKKLGYLPENPYVYQYLTPLEFLDLCGSLMGMKAAERKTRSKEMLERVGLSQAASRPIGKFSKGMTQRVGIAQCLLHDPELIILDEPMSGLDPIGRKEIRDLLMAERQRGKTILITTHILNDVETLCDHVAIVQGGKVAAAGSIQTLLKSNARLVEIELLNVSSDFRAELQNKAQNVTSHDNRTMVIANGDDHVQEILRLALAHNAHIAAVTPHRDTLEDLFVRNAMRTGTEPTA